MSRTQQPVGDQIRWWRGHRRMTQLDLANRAEVSTRHVSFLETGRARPTRAMLLRLGDHLDIPLRDRNAMLLAAGFAPAFPEHTLTDVPMAVVSDAIRTILTAHAPMPALVVDRHWNLVDANDTVALLTDGAAPRLLEPPVNVLRLSLHPDGMASRITNLAQWRAHVLHRLASYASGADPAEPEPSLVVPLRVRVGDYDLSFLSTTTVFGTPLDVAVSELAIETFFPADAATSEFLAARR